MGKVIRRWGWRLVALAMSGWVFQAGCLRIVQQELDLLWRPEANLGLLNSSVLVDLFGPAVLRFW